MISLVSSRKWISESCVIHLLLLFPDMTSSSLILSMEKLKSKESNESVFISSLDILIAKKWISEDIVRSRFVCKVRSWRRLAFSVKMNWINGSVFQRIWYLWNTSVYFSWLRHYAHSWLRRYVKTSRQLRHNAKIWAWLCNYANKSLSTTLRTRFLITPLRKNFAPITHYAINKRAHYAITLTYNAPHPTLSH